MSLVPRTALSVPDHQIEAVQYAHASSDDNAKIFLIDILAAISRNWKIALTAAVLAGAVVLVATYFITPLYQSTATIMLDTRHEQVVDLQAVLSSLPSDTFVVDSEVQVLQSPALARRVITKLHLDQDPEFNAALRPPSLLSQAAGAVKATVRKALSYMGVEPASDVDRPDRRAQSVVNAFEKNLNVSRQGLTYVIDITFWSDDPAKAVRIANAVAQTYIDQQKAVKTDATHDANALLNKHVAELQKQVHDAEQAVADYKAQHGLLTAVGTPLTEQEITALETQLATAQAQQAEQEGKLNAAISQYNSGGTNAVGQAATSDTVRALRSQQATLLQQKADLAQRYGPKHPALIKVKEQLAAVDQAIAAEISRIIGNQQAETAAARQRTQSLQASIASDRKILAQHNLQGVRLGELQRDATAVRSVYESFLSRLKQTSAQEGLAAPDAQIISPANIPLKPSSPSWALAMAAAAVLAAMAAAAAILLREFFDRGVRTPDQAENAIGLPVLAMMPQVNHADPATYVIRWPISDYAEAIRNLRASLFLSRSGAPPQVVALMSALPHEGKTTTTLALGRQAAESGKRVVIIDADRRRRTLTQHLTVPIRQGLGELVWGQAKLEDCLYRDTQPNVYILPLTGNDTDGKDVFFSNDLGRVFTMLRQKFDIVLIDTPPLLPLAEPRVVARHADSVLLLARWRKTPQSAMQEAARLMRTLDVPIAGMALSYVDMKLLNSFGYSSRGSSQRARYTSYYIQ